MTEHSEPRASETLIHGIGVSPGVAVGPAFVLVTDDVHVVERDIAPAEVDHEIARFESALIETRRQLRNIQKTLSSSAAQSDASIFDAHLMVLDDRALVEEVIVGIEERHKNVEAVLRDAAGRYAEALSAVEDEYLKERVADIKDVTRRLLHNLCGKQNGAPSAITGRHIVLAADISPSSLVGLPRDAIMGFATDAGSATSHTAVMARALGIPAVVATHDVSARVATGDEVLLDGNRGLVIQRPTPQRLDEYGKMALARDSIETDLRKLRHAPAVTSDGVSIALAANIEMAEDVKHVREAGANGVGLFRSEYLYLAKRRLPTEDELFQSYDAVARELAPAPVIIRTLDAGGDKFLSYIGLPREENPFLGCRAIRFCLAHPDIFRAQLRAILRASRHGNVKVMYPMVSVADELARANALLEEAKQDLQAQQIRFDRGIEVGAMVETPSAALSADLLAPMVKFFSLGTNDLIQYTFAVDRVNEQVAHLYEPTHPAVLRLIRATVDAGGSRGVWTGVCGEMAANPILAPLLIGLGVAELSMAPAALPAVKAAIRRVSMADARELARSAMAATSGADVLALCRSLAQRAAPEILALVG